MKANELQIDDWAACEGKNGKVKELREHKLLLKTENSVMIVYYNSVEPIPLSAEILEKNFPTIEDGVTWNETADSDLFNIRVEYDKYVEGIFKYTHELQHSLKLAGIDKEIEL